VQRGRIDSPGGGGFLREYFAARIFRASLVDRVLIALINLSLRGEGCFHVNAELDNTERSVFKMNRMDTRT